MCDGEPVAIAPDLGSIVRTPVSAGCILGGV